VGRTDLFQRVQQAYAGRINVVRPRDCDVATLQGAARYGLGKATVSSVISPRSYIMSSSSFLSTLIVHFHSLSHFAECRLPAEDQDRYTRPGFVSLCYSRSFTVFLVDLRLTDFFLSLVTFRRSRQTTPASKSARTD